MNQDLSLVRIVRIGIALGVAGTIFFWITRDARIATGFLAGAALSILSFRSLRRMVVGFEPGSTIRARWATVFFILRYLIFGAAAYGIVKLLGISLTPFLAGLFISPAAVMVEILYELAAPK